MFSHYRRLRLRAVWVMAIMAYLFLFVLLRPAEAAVVRNYAIRFTTNDTGDVAIVGNRLSTCGSAVANCTNAVNGIGNTLNNNSFALVHVDIDTDPTTFNSSSANLTLPAGATVLWAGLYWGADVNNGTASTNQARIRVPGAGGYAIVTAAQLDTTASQVAGRTRYQGFAPITAQVQAAGSGTYMVANVQTTAGNTDSYAAWALVVVYRDVSRPLRNLTVFDGFAYVTAADQAVSIPVSGFTTPLSGPVTTKIGTVVYEGDLGLTGDSVRLNNTLLSDGQNPSANYFNSTIANLGVRVTSKNPDNVNQMAFDIDMVSAGSILGNGATSAAIRFSTESDAYYPGVISFVTDLHAPQLGGNIVKSVVDVNGGQVEPDDILQYAISLANTGLDGATNVILYDTIPANTSYVANSLVITSGANSGAKSDTAGNDQAEFDAGQNRVVFRLGTGANGTAGGTLGIGAATAIRFQVRVNTPLANAVVVTNQASVNYSAATTGQGYTSPSNPAAVVVVAAPQLSVTKRDTVLTDTAPLGPSPGDTLRYTVQITNQGNANATGVVFSDTPDANTMLLNGSVTTSQGTVTSGNGGEPGVRVDLGTLSGLGGAATLTFDVRIADPVPAGVTQVRNQGLLSSSELPPLPTDDPDTAPAGDPTVTPITAAPALAAYKSDALSVDADGDGVPSPGDTVAYTIIIANHGNQDATGVVLSDIPDPNAPLVAGSVSSSQGTVTTGNLFGDQLVGVAIGSVAGGGSVTVQFLVTVALPLPAGVAIIANQALIGSDQLPPVRSDDPDTAVAGDPTVTPLSAAPLLLATKRASLIDDADGDGVPSPGDTLQYQITLVNHGNGAASGLTFADTPDPNTALVSGSVQASQGTVLRGNAPGDGDVDVNLTTLLGGAGATVSFNVVVRTALLPSVTQVSNQGIVSCRELPPLPTDDPDTAAMGDPTATPITAAPRLVVSKQDTLSADRDGDGQPSPGDILLYRVIIANTGNGAAEDVFFSDTLDPHLSLNVGTVQTTGGIVTSGNGGGDADISVAVGTIPANGALTITFQASISTPLPAGVTRVVNQGFVSSSALPSVASDDPDTLAAGDATVTLVAAQPRLMVTKSVSLWSDADGDGAASAGDTLAYHIEVANHGNQDATGVILNDLLDPHAMLTPFSVQTGSGSILSGNNPGDHDVRVDLGVVPAGSTVQIGFQVLIASSLPAGITEISNQAAVNSNELPTVLSDDPATLIPADPTIIQVVSAPNLLAHKSWTLGTDADADGLPSPGDTLQYVVQIANTGTSTATLVVFSDTPGLNTTLVSGSVQASHGAVISGNSPADTDVAVNMGALPPGTFATIAFAVGIDAPFPDAVDTVSNQGLVTSSELADVPTDDPSTPTPGDPTVTAVSAIPILDVTKEDNLAVDADGDGQPSPGDTLFYNVTIRNSGQVSATQVSFSDTPGAYSSLIAGSVVTNRGTVSVGNGAGDVDVVVAIGALPANRSALISFMVQIAAPLPDGVTVISNQGVVTSSELGAQPSNDPATTTPADPTETVVHAAPDLRISKSDGGAILVLRQENQLRSELRQRGHPGRHGRGHYGDRAGQHDVLRGLE